MKRIRKKLKAILIEMWEAEQYGVIYISRHFPFIALLRHFGLVQTSYSDRLMLFRGVSVAVHTLTDRGRSIALMLRANVLFKPRYHIGIDLASGHDFTAYKENHTATKFNLK